MINSMNKHFTRLIVVLNCLLLFSAANARIIAQPQRQVNVRIVAPVSLDPNTGIFARTLLEANARNAPTTHPAPLSKATKAIRAKAIVTVHEQQSRQPITRRTAGTTTKTTTAGTTTNQQPP